MDIEKLYNESRKITNYYIQKYSSIDRDEINSISNEIFTKCLKKYDINKGYKFNTYFAKALRVGVVRLYKKYVLNLEVVLEDTEIEYNSGRTQEDDVIFYDSISSLSHNSKTLLNACINTPDKLVKYCTVNGRTKINLRGITDYLWKEKIIPLRKINKSIYEIKEVLNKI